MKYIKVEIIGIFAYPYLIPRLKGPRVCSTRSSIAQPCYTTLTYLWHMITLPTLQADDPLRNRWYAVILRDDVVLSRHSYCLCYRARLQPCDPCFCIVRPRPVQSETESGIDGFPNGQSVRRATEPWEAKYAGDPVPGVANKWKPRLELHVRNWNHIVRAVGVARKTKHQMRDASRQPKTKHQPIIPSCWL